jgi:hypothetical protein
LDQNRTRWLFLFADLVTAAGRITVTQLPAWAIAIRVAAGKTGRVGRTEDYAQRIGIRTGISVIALFADFGFFHAGRSEVFAGIIRKFATNFALSIASRRVDITAIATNRWMGRQATAYTHRHFLLTLVV